MHKKMVNDWSTCKYTNHVTFLFRSRSCGQNNSKRYLFHDLGKILGTDISDTTKMYIHKFSFQDLDEILFIAPKIPRSCLQDVRLGSLLLVQKHIIFQTVSEIKIS